jgi:DNA-binding transcriptional regulator YdaS (Cro superfamily)
MRVQWIDEELAARDMPRRRLAEAIPGLTETKLSLVMSGRRKLSADEADAIRRFFGYVLPDDPADPLTTEIHKRLAKLGAGQRHAVALYLAALAGDDPGPPPEV